MRPVDQPEFWRERLERTKEHGRTHEAIYHCSASEFHAMNMLHTDQLAAYITPLDSVLDVGCGYGRLLDLLPENWRGDYLGIDVSPEFIQKAKLEHPQSGACHTQFFCGDLESILLGVRNKEYDWAVCIMFWDLAKNNIDCDKWERIEKNIRRVAKQILILEPLAEAVVL